MTANRWCLDRAFIKIKKRAVSLAQSERKTNLYLHLNSFNSTQPRVYIYCKRITLCTHLQLELYPLCKVAGLHHSSSTGDACGGGGVIGPVEQVDLSNSSASRKNKWPASA